MTRIAHNFDDGAAYERSMGKWSRAVGRVFLEWLAPPADAHWLDVGCGTGAFTKLILGSCSPAAVRAVDPAAAQIAYARSQELSAVEFRVAPAEALPFAAQAFDLAVSALVINFVSDRPRALAEMRRVTRAGGTVAGYVWDFAADLSPSGPIRRALKQIGVGVPPIPGTEESRLASLLGLFEATGLEAIRGRSFEVTVAFADFDEFWQAQTPAYHPMTHAIAGLSRRDRARLIECLRADLSVRDGEPVEYAARANARRARVPT